MKIPSAALSRKMIDTKKIDEQNKLAKKLVDSRIAASMEDAMRQIQKHDDMPTEEFKLSPHSKDIEEKKETKSAPVNHDMDEKLIEIEKKVNRLGEFFNKFRDVVNKNFREIDQRLTAIKVQNAAVPRKAEKKEEVKQQKLKPAKPVKTPHPKSDPDNYTSEQVSVESIFSNRNNRLTDKK